jgi:hypothetical protein
VFDDGPDTVEFSKEKRNEMLNRLREMMGEEPEPLTPEPGEPEEIPEDTPYYLNPEILNKEDEEGEEAEEGKDAKGPEGPGETAEPIESRESGPGTGPEVRDREPGNILAGQSPEKVETVLNSGMQFMAGLMEMATGQKMEKSGDQDKMITIDRDTGEVTMKFKLPGF